MSYYFSGSFYIPHAIVDGILDAGTGYTMWGNFIRGRAVVDAPVSIQLEGYTTMPPNQGVVRVLAEATDFLSFATMRLFVVITEDSIYYNAPNGTQWHNQTMRDMLPTAYGDPITGFMSPGDTIVREYSYDISSWAADKCNVVVFIQDYATKEILQCASSRISELTVGIEESEGRDLGPLFTLSPGCPNPFNDRARIEYTIPSAGRVKLHIYDSSGSLVRTLVRGWESAGKHMEYWDGKDDHGREVASGIYFSRLSYEGNTKASKVSLVR